MLPTKAYSFQNSFRAAFCACLLPLRCVTCHRRQSLQCVLADVPERTDNFWVTGMLRVPIRLDWQIESARPASNISCSRRGSPENPACQTLDVVQPPMPPRCMWAALSVHLATDVTEFCMCLMPHEENHFGAIVLKKMYRRVKQERGTGYTLGQANTQFSETGKMHNWLLQTPFAKEA